MKVLILGGAGFQGSRAARLLASRPEVNAVVLGDLSREAAETAAARLGEKAIGIRVDALDSDALAASFAEHAPDVVLNCAGPFRYTGPAALRAAIRSRVNYVDLLDDEQVVDDFLAMSDDAAAAGITAVTGFGFTPGMSNILGRHLADQLDVVEELHWTYLVNATRTVAPHLMGHRVQLFGPDAKMIRDGDIVSVPGGSQEIEIDWGRYGRTSATTCTHPEPMLAHRYFPGIRRAVIRACYTEESFPRLLATLGNAGLGSEAPLVVGGRAIAPEIFIGEFLTSDAFTTSDVWRRVLAAEDDLGPVDGLRVVASGIRGGAHCILSATYLSSDRWTATHGTAAIGAFLVGSGILRLPGVNSPEAFPADRIMQELRDCGLEITEREEADAPEIHA
ncbi:saccharopine dehydrogenase NADP-binding domain-containing protein [Rathayibacter sp. Leaf296]|uniref:saccharopine dehydrogenase NADP-binding domain-containing protein n=1 Tax=Rathayibacter sp. Leaf296 TaxID=1736327 RepID=UPI00138F30B8|nr:saccharopine dehydrogenase NADP-binding domain-containing protein [Rathayibacter sp. Leaf296]